MIVHPGAVIGADGFGIAFAGDYLSAASFLGICGMIATAGYDVNVYKSARNIDRVSVCPVAELNALAVLQPRQILVTKDALDAIQQRA